MYINKDQVYGNLRRTATKGLISILNINIINELARKHFAKIENGQEVLSCPYSGVSIYDEKDAVLEHIISVSSGGGTVLFNCVPTHVFVNNHNEKGTKHLLDWWINSGYFSYDRLEKLLDYIFEAYDITFSMYTPEEVVLSYESVISKFTDMQIENESDGSLTSDYSASLIDYYQFLKDCISELELGGYNVEKYQTKLKKLIDNKIFNQIKKYEEIQSILKSIIAEKTGLDNRYELTVALNINTPMLARSFDDSLSYEDIKTILIKRINDIEHLMLANNLTMLNYFDNIRDLSFFLEKDISEFKSEEIQKLINDCKYSWDKGYELAVKYYEKHGNLKVTCNFCTINGYDYDPEGYNLGTWLSRQRQSRKNQGSCVINEEQINKLDRLDIIWEPFIEKWEQMYLLAEKYYEYYGNLNVVYNFKTTNGIDYDEKGLNLGRWITHQRQNKKGNGHGKLTEEQEKRLDSIGMIWEPMQATWNVMYNLAQKYYSHYGNLIIPASFVTNDGITIDENGETLGRWIVQQREKYRNNFSEYRSSDDARKLEAIGMKWYVKEEAIKTAFDYMFGLAQKYYLHHNNLDVPKRFKTINGYDPNEKGENLGTWIQSQRTKYKTPGSGKGNLTEEQIKALESIGMVWDALEKDWNEMYALAEKYYEHYGDLNVPVRFSTQDGINPSENGINLGRWITVQRRTYASREISEERITKLENLKIVWDVKAIEWENMYKLASKFYEHYHHLNIPQRFKTNDGLTLDEDGVALGSWICTQRKALISGKITEERVQRLNEIGMVWAISRNEKQRVSPELGGKSNARRSA